MMKSKISRELCLQDHESVFFFQREELIIISVHSGGFSESKIEKENVIGTITEPACGNV